MKIQSYANVEAQPYEKCFYFIHIGFYGHNAFTRTKIIFVTQSKEKKQQSTLYNYIISLEWCGYFVVVAFFSQFDLEFIIIGK